MCSVGAELFAVSILNEGHFETQDGRHTFGRITCVPQLFESSDILDNFAKIHSFITL